MNIETLNQVQGDREKGGRYLISNVAANFSLRKISAGCRPGDPTRREACGYDLGQFVMLNLAQHLIKAMG